MSDAVADGDVVPELELDAEGDKVGDDDDDGELLAEPVATDDGDPLPLAVPDAERVVAPLAVAESDCEPDIDPDADCVAEAGAVTVEVEELVALRVALSEPDEVPVREADGVGDAVATPELLAELDQVLDPLTESVDEKLNVKAALTEAE